MRRSRGRWTAWSGSVPDASGVSAMRWWGWGDPAHPQMLSAQLLAFLNEVVGVSDPLRPPVALRHVRLAPPALGEQTLHALRGIVGADGFRDDHSERVLHAAGKGYMDLVRLRAGEPEGAPDAVVLPSDHDQVRAVLELCARASVAVV